MTGATGVIDVAEVERLAGWAAGLGPSLLRADMRGEARLRVLEALNAGCTSGLGLVAYRGAMGAFKAATFQAGLRQSRVATDSATGAMSLGVLLSDDARGAYGMWDGSAASEDPIILGPVLDRVLDDLVERGVERHGIGEALGLLLDKAEYSRGPRTSELVRKTHSATGRRSRVFDVPAKLMAERSGLSVQACSALTNAHTDARMRRAADEIVGQIGGVDLRLKSEPGWDIAVVGFTGLTLRRLEFDRGELSKTDALGLARQVEHRLHSLPAVRDAAQERIGVIDSETQSLTALRGRHFDRAGRLSTARERPEEIDAELAASAEDAPTDEAIPVSLPSRPVVSNSALAWALEAASEIPAGHVSIAVIGRGSPNL